jgi:hypothetical protein
MPIDQEISATSIKSAKKTIGKTRDGTIGKPKNSTIGKRRTIGTFDLSALWESAIPDLSVLDEKAPDSVHKWRKEVIQGGKYWQWRIGSADSRKARYGGTFSTLSNDRKAEYERNKKTKRSKAKRRIPVTA